MNKEFFKNYFFYLKISIFSAGLGVLCADLDKTYAYIISLPKWLKLIILLCAIFIFPAVTAWADTRISASIKEKNE